MQETMRSVKLTIDRMLKSFESFSKGKMPLYALGLKIQRSYVCVEYVSDDSNLVDSASSIRLSQRLSHACLSINNFIRETANGSLYQL